MTNFSSPNNIPRRVDTQPPADSTPPQNTAEGWLGRLELYSEFIVIKLPGIQPYIVDPTQLETAITSLEFNSGLLPLNCLSWSIKEGLDKITIYIPPRLWSLQIIEEHRPWQVPLPGFVFTGHDRVYYLWAVTELPAHPYIQLYRAPCPHVNFEGLCFSEMPLPQADVATIWHAADIFFAGRFGRKQVEGKSRAAEGNILHHWQALARAGVITYPLDDLVQTELTLRRFLDG
jgi:Prokaryotic E2 family D